MNVLGQQVKILDGINVHEDDQVQLLDLGDAFECLEISKRVLTWEVPSFNAVRQIGRASCRERV